MIRFRDMVWLVRGGFDESGFTLGLNHVHSVDAYTGFGSLRTTNTTNPQGQKMNLFAYLDPGSSTLIIQAVLGGTAGAAVLFKTMGNKFKRKNKAEDGAGDSEIGAGGSEIGAGGSEAVEAAEPSVRPQTSD
jgi:hypothetical protein